MKISILGTGAYGLALATMFCENKNNVIMWSKFDDEVNRLRNTNSFRGQTLPNTIKYTTNMQECIEDCDLIVIAIPVAFISDTVFELKKYYQNQCILIASKGIEQKSNLFATNIVNNHIKVNDIGVISGGTFATDMMKKEPMGLTLATKSNYLKEIVLTSLKNEYLKMQTTEDIIGVEICGSVKNIMAIASGMIEGLHFGDSTKHLFITEAIYEIQNLISLFGGSKDTILTYAGIDDISMTCSSSNSRNYSLGKFIGNNVSKEEIENYKKETTIEGLYTTLSFYDLLKQKGMECPLIDIIYQILYQDENPNKLIEYLKEK